MASNQERRRAALLMRRLDVSEFKDSPIVPFLECLNVGYMNWRGVMDRLADLVDRPTCRIRTDVEDEGTIWDLYGTCTRCGATVDASAAIMTWDGFIPTRYCPYCGAEVVRDD